MYGTIAKLRVKKGAFDDLSKTLKRENSGKGYIGHYIYQMDDDPQEFYLAAIFESKETYHKYAQSPESNAEYEAMTPYLDGDPEWHDGEIVFSQLK